MRLAALGRSALAACVALALGMSLGACADTGAAGTFTPRVAGTLTVATAQIPDPGLWEGRPARITGGFEYGLARALASRFGLARTRVIVVPFKQLVEGHLAKADLALSDITVTSERSQHISFSTPYLAAPPAILVRPGTQVPDVHSAQELSWAVESGTTLQGALEGTIRPSAAPLVLAHEREVLHALRSGRVQAVMLDLPVALAYAREAPRAYAVAAQLPSEDVLAAALPKGSENIEALDSAIRALMADGTIDRLARESLDTSISEGQAEHVPALRIQE